MVTSSIIRQKVSPTVTTGANNSSYSYVQAYPLMVDQADYEIQVHVNFQTREMRLLKVLGAADEADIFLFTREKCQPDCADDNCRVCRTRKLYQDKAGDPQGSVPYSPDQEYLYCLRFDRQPITALLSLTPRDQDVEVKEKGVLAYWFMKWHERSKILHVEGAVAGLNELQLALMEGGGQAPGHQPAPLTSAPDPMLECRAADPKEERRASDTNEERRASDPKEERRASEPKEERRASEPKEERRTSDLNEERRASNPKEERRASDPNEERRASDPKEERRASDPKEERSTSDPNEERRASDPKEERRASDPKEERRASDPKEERRASDPKEERRASDPKEERRASDPKEERRATDPKEERRASNSKEERRASEPNEERRASDPNVERRASDPRAERRASDPNEERRASDPIVERRASDPATQVELGPMPAAVRDQAKQGDEDDEPDFSAMHRSSLPVAEGTTSEDCLHKQTSSYLPNLQVIYHVKKDQMSVVLPKPEQLTRPIDIILTSVDKYGNSKRQSIPLLPGAVSSNNSLVALRNTAYTLQVQLHDKGRPVDLLDFITEQKILRVQESKEAPKQLNFLMERLIEQRGTFVLHITFDEKIVEVGTKPIGEFYLDVDVDAHRIMIGTIETHAEKLYRVEKISKQAGSNILLAEKQLIFEGGVDPNTLAIRESIPIERMSDYMITVVDPVTKQSLPTSVLAFHKHALFVKEIKNSDVRLHVTVQRQPSLSLQSSNANNLRSPAASPVLAIRRPDPDAAFHCPFRSGWTTFRIHHARFESRSETVPSETPMTTSTADTVSKVSEPCLNLDVDLPALKARLLPEDCQSLDGAVFIVYEESFDGKMRSTSCKMTQPFKIRPWCKYTVKCVEGTKQNPLLTFCVTDKEVTDIRPCSSTVRVGKRFVLEVA